MVPVESNEAERLISMVLSRDGQLNIEALNALLALRDKLKAEKAEAEFLAAVRELSMAAVGVLDDLATEQAADFKRAYERHY